MITEKIIQTTSKTRAEVIALFKSGLDTQLFFQSGRIMSGSIDKGIIRATTGLSGWFLGGFKSRVRGKVGLSDKQTSIQLRLSPAWSVIIPILSWLFFMGSLLINAKQLRFEGASYTYTALLILFPAALGKLKLNWDRIRIERWLTTGLNTPIGNGFKHDVFIMSHLLSELRMQSAQGTTPIEHIGSSLQEVAKLTSRSSSELRRYLDRLIEGKCDNLISSNPLVFELTDYGLAMQDESQIEEFGLRTAIDY